MNRFICMRKKKRRAHTPNQKKGKERTTTNIDTKAIHAPNNGFNNNGLLIIAIPDTRHQTPDATPQSTKPSTRTHPKPLTRHHHLHPHLQPPQHAAAVGAGAVAGLPVLIGGIVGGGGARYPSVIVAAVSGSDTAPEPRRGELHPPRACPACCSASNADKSLPPPISPPPTRTHPSDITNITSSSSIQHGRPCHRGASRGGAAAARRRGACAMGNDRIGRDASSRW